MTPPTILSCAGCKSWPIDGCVDPSPAARQWREESRVTLGDPATQVPADTCPGWRPKRRTSRIPERFRPWTLPGEMSPAAVATRIAREAVDALAPLREPGESVKDVLKRVDRSNAVLCCRRDEAVQDAQTARAERDGAKARLADVNEALVAVRAENDRIRAARKDDLDALSASRRSLAGARETLDGANKVLDALGAPAGLLADRIHGHAVGMGMAHVAETAATVKALRAEIAAANKARDTARTQAGALLVIALVAGTAAILSFLVGAVA